MQKDFGLVCPKNENTVHLNVVHMVVARKWEINIDVNISFINLSQCRKRYE